MLEHERSLALAVKHGGAREVNATTDGREEWSAKQWIKYAARSARRRIFVVDAKLPGTGYE